MSIPDNKLPVCLNCGYEFKSENIYCPVCGQKNHDLKVPFKHLVGEFFESTLHLDSKTFKTIKFLLFKPGYLSLEFNAGKRVSFVPPIRLYIFISFIFFFLLNFLSGSNKSEGGLNNKEKTKPRIVLSFRTITTADLAGLTQTQVDSLIEARQIENKKFNRWAVYQLHKIANNSTAEFTHLLMKNISYMMFVLMPAFGAVILLFNRKQAKHYIESLILSIHFHSFVFFLFTLVWVVIFIFQREIYFLGGFLILPVYMLIMFKNYFKQTIWITIIKTFFISSIYLLSFLVLLLLTIAVSVILI